MRRYLYLSCLFIFIHIELDTTGVIEGDNDSPQAMGDPNIEVYFLLEIILSINMSIFE